MTAPPLPVSLEEFDAIVARNDAVERGDFTVAALGAHVDRSKLIALVRWWREASSARASELLEANNAEVERRRVAEDVAVKAASLPLRTDDAFIQSILHLPRCRDCADRVGRDYNVCDDGLPCAPEHRRSAVKTLLNRINYLREHPEFVR